MNFVNTGAHKAMMCQRLRDGEAQRHANLQNRRDKIFKLKPPDVPAVQRECHCRKCWRNAQVVASVGNAYVA